MKNQKVKIKSSNSRASEAIKYFRPSLLALLLISALALPAVAQESQIIGTVSVALETPLTLELSSRSRVFINQNFNIKAELKNIGQNDVYGRVFMHGPRQRQFGPQRFELASQRLGSCSGSIGLSVFRYGRDHDGMFSTVGYGEWCDCDGICPARIQGSKSNRNRHYSRFNAACWRAACRTWSNCWGSSSSLMSSRILKCSSSLAKPKM